MTNLQTADDKLETLTEAAATAFVFTLPLFQMEALRRRGMSEAGMGTFAHGRMLYDHRNRHITTPNNDTLYSFGWLDLRRGPARVTLPPPPGRYASLAFLDMYTNNFLVLDVEEGVRQYTVIGPDDAIEGPTATTAGTFIRSPTPICLMLARVLVEGPDDVAAAAAIQDGFRIEMLSDSDDDAPLPLPEGIETDQPWDRHLAAAAKLLDLCPPSAADQAAISRMAPLGLSRFDPARFSPDEGAAIERGLDLGRARIQGEIAVIRERADGWTTPALTQGDFRRNYLHRARVSISGLCALPRDEAIYFIGSRFGGDPLSGDRPMRWHMPAGALPPVDGFWSLTMYEFNELGERYFTENPIGRYSIGDRTEGLSLNDDGSLDIWIGHESPSGARRTNWLPAPKGRYSLTLRAYRPGAALVERDYRLPEVTPAEEY